MNENDLDLQDTDQVFFLPYLSAPKWRHFPELGCFISSPLVFPGRVRFQGWPGDGGWGSHSSRLGTRRQPPRPKAMSGAFAVGPTRRGRLRCLWEGWATGQRLRTRTGDRGMQARGSPPQIIYLLFIPSNLPYLLPEDFAVSEIPYLKIHVS